jgi:tetratricopeptide (TPR) repeat protein
MAPCALPVRRRDAAPYLTGPRQGKRLARLDADQADLRRAAGHAAGDPEGTAHVLRFGVALERYWTTRHRTEEALALLMPVLDRPGARAGPELFAAALLTATRLAASGHADIARARQLGEQAVHLARELDTDRLLTGSLAALSYVCYLAGDPERGLPAGREAVRRARQLGDDVLLGESLLAYLAHDDLIESAHVGPLLAEAIACTRRSGDHLYASFVSNHVGVRALRAGDIPAARAHLQRAAQVMRATGDTDEYVAINMGWVLRQDHDPDGARSSFQTALRRDRRRGNHSGMAYGSLGLACLAADTGEWQRAAVLHGAAQALLDLTGQRWEELEARYRQDSLHHVRAHLGQEQFERAHARGTTLSPDEALDLTCGRTPSLILPAT